MTLLRLCFAKRDETLDSGRGAAERLHAPRVHAPRIAAISPMKKSDAASIIRPTVEVPADNRPVVAPIYQTVKFEFDTRRGHPAVAARRAAGFLLLAQLQSDSRAARS